MLKVLKQPYPLNYFNRFGLIFATGIGLFVFLFLYIFQPFDLFDRTFVNYAWACAGFGGITFIMVLVFAYVLPLLFPKYFNDQRWKVLDEIVWIHALVLTIAFINFFYSSYITIEGCTWGDLQMGELSKSIFQTFAIGSIPTIGVVMINHIRLLNKNQKAGEEMSQGLATDKAQLPEKEILLHSANKNEQVSILLQQFRFAEAQGNYVEVHTEKEDSWEKVMLRTTLTKLEEQLMEYDVIIRTHRAYIVNTGAVAKVEGNAQGLQLFFENGHQPVPVSRQKTQELKELMNG